MSTHEVVQLILVNITKQNRLILKKYNTYEIHIKQRYTYKNMYTHTYYIQYIYT